MGGGFCCCLNQVSNIVSTSFHVCLWSVVLKYRVAQSIGVLSFTKETVSPPVTGNFSCPVTIRQKDFYIRSFQTPTTVLYACLEIRPNHTCVLFTTGILRYGFPGSSFSGAPHQPSQSASDPPPIPRVFPWNSTFVLSSFPWPLLPTYKGTVCSRLVFYLHTWWCACSKFLLKL